MTDSTRRLPPDAERLRDVLSAFVAADEAGMLRLLEASDDILLDPSAEAILRANARMATEHGKIDAAKIYFENANILAACRAHGAAVVFTNPGAIFDTMAHEAEIEVALAELRQLANENNGSEDALSLQRQVTLSRSLLSDLPPTKNSDLRAAVSRTLGNALRRLGDKTGDITMLQQAEQVLRTLLVEFTREHTPTQWASTQNNLGIVLRSLGVLAGDSAILLQAEQAFDEALLERTRDHSPIEWAMTQSNLGNVLASLGRLTGDSAALRKAAQAYRNALLVRTRERSPMDWALTQINLGNLLKGLGDLTGDAESLLQAEQAFHAALLVFTREINASKWATINNNIGTVLKSLGVLTGDSSTLRQAEQLYQNALLEHTRERSPMDWAMTQNNLGNLLQSLSDLTGDAAVLRRAEKAFRDALLERTRHRSPMHWATTQNNLGNLLCRLGALTGKAAVLREAERAYRDALLERTRVRSPLDWAATQSNLGNLLHSLGDLTGDVATLRQAEYSYYQALCERTRDRCPMDWAITQNNLGNLKQALGQLTGDANALRDALSAYRNALLEFTRDSSAMQWAATQNNLGNTLLSLGELTGDAGVLRQAAEVYSDALLERTQERTPMDWARTQNSLGNALHGLGELFSDMATLQQSENAFRNALLERTRDRTPMEWATTQNNLGNLLRTIGHLVGDKSIFLQAERAFRDALLERARDRAPMDWAMTQNSLGNILRDLGELTIDLPTLRQSEEAFLGALQEYTVERAPINCATIRINLGSVLQSINKITGDISTLHQSEQNYRAAFELLRQSGAEDQAQTTIGSLARVLASLGQFEESAQVVNSAIQRSDIAIADASRSEDGRARAIEVVGALYGLLSLCHLRCANSDITAAFSAAVSGRARLLADALAFSGVGAEAINDPDVREEIERATARRRELRFQLGYERADSTFAPRELAADLRAQLQADLHDATEAWAMLLRRHGLIRTPEPLTLADIQAAVPDGGALVLPVLTEQAAFVFILTDSGAPEVVELPGLDRRAVVAHLSGETNWLGVYNRHFGDYEGKDPAASAVWGQCLTGTLAWLWERLLAPIHVHLRDVARLAANAPIVLLPPGLLGVLPLHAAGPGPDGRCFGDHWTVSYAPSVRSLLTCQDRRDARASQPARLLAAIDPDGSLSGARAEGPMLQQRFAAPGREPVVMTGKEATIARILGELPNATVFHASTHGTHDPVEPARSGLLLADGALELDMLRHARLDAMRLVFLSACESGLAGVRRLPEEFIGLPTGLVEAGAAAVVGSLWPIGDISAFLLARRFYDLMYDAAGEECMAPATALREACAWLRGVTFGELKREFPLVQLPSGPALVLRSARMMPGALEPDRPAPPEAPHLPLGLDDERPFAHPTHWAAFTITGC